MGVYIKGMEMPKNCYECPFLMQADYWNKDDEADILSKCKRTKEFTWESINGYLPNCPLVPVPPHGGLIDRDALVKSDRMVGKLMMYGGEYVYTQAEIDRAPTIIPADESNMDSFIRIFEEDDEENGMDSFIRILKD